jgi:hypothetical protein
MTERGAVFSTSLTISQVREARKHRYYILTQDVIAQHPEDGGIVIPAGRMVHSLKRGAPDNEYTYVTAEMYVLAPGVVDTRSGLPPDIVKMKAPIKRPFRILVLPKGEECSYLRQIGLDAP